MKWSVISPICNDYPHIWFCLHAHIEHIRHDFKPDEFEFIIVDGGSRPENLRLLRRLMGTRTKKGGPKKPLGLPKQFSHTLIEYPEELHSKPNMNRGAWAAKGKYLAFFDSHAFGDRDFFKTAYEFMEKHPEVAILHAPIAWHGMWVSKRTFGHQYKMKLDTNFWGVWRAARLSEEPYPIAASGWAGCVVRRDAYMHMKGFPGALRHYGGGEPYMDILAWMFGYEVYLHPQLHCYHFALTPSRDYKRDSSSYFRNIVMCAHICGGEKYSKRLLERKLETQGPNWAKRYTFLYNQAVHWARLRRKFVEKNAKYTLDQVLEIFKERNIFH